MSPIHSHAHEAMKTTFTFRIAADDPALARKASHDCIALLDQIEASLSRYIEGSDVWQINHMQAGETLFISQLSYDCLRIALEACEQTAGLFDITLGSQIEHQKNKREGAPPAIRGQLAIDPKRPAIHCTEAGREIDLGGIGKGFALDKMKDLMQDWGIESALISAGGSTQVAFGNDAWKISLIGDTTTKEFELKNQALSASGSAIQGSHIISPRKGPTYPYKHTRIWALTTSAALADALSTSAMLMSHEEMIAMARSGDSLFVEHNMEIRSILEID